MLMEPPGSASTASLPAARNQSSAASTTPAASTRDTSPTEAWNDALAQARANSPQQTVRAKPGDSLASIASSNSDTLSSVETDNPQVYPPDLLHIGQIVRLPKKTPAEVVTGVNNSRIKPIITAMAYANLADQGLDSPVLAHDPEALGEAQAQSAQSWNTVEQKTLKMLLNNNYNPHPDKSANAEVQQLNALEPGNAKFAAANNGALNTAIKQWQQMGVTKSQLSGIMDAYNNAKQATDSANLYLQNPKLPHNPTIVGEVNANEQQANAQLQGKIETWLKQQAGSNPTAAAVGDQADTIAKFGPHDPIFTTAVKNAAYDLQVVEPAQKVTNAYATGMRQGGAQAATQQAAQTLATVTRQAGDAHFALQIIQQSQGTIDQITKELGSLAASSQSALYSGSSGAVTSFNQIYGDLSQSVNSATPIDISAGPNGKTSITLGADGKTAADLVGGSIAANAPNNPTPYQSGFYQGAAANAIANGDGAGLSLATAATFKEQGNSNLASYVVEGATQGFQGLKSKTDSAVGDFGATNADLYQIRTTWTPFMTNNSDVAKATNGYFADHKNVAQKAQAELATIGGDGDAIVEATSAWNTYGPQLAGIGGPKNQYAFGTQTVGNGTKDLSAAAASLTGNDNAAAFAVSQSARLNTAIANRLFPLMEQLGGGPGWESWPGWSSIGSGRSALSAGAKTASKSGGLLFPAGKLSTPTANRISLGLSVVGLGLTALNASRQSWGFGSAPDAVDSIYTSLGFAKYIGETYSGLAKLSKLPNALTYSNQDGSAAAKVLFGNNAEGLTNSPAFKALGFFYYGAGAFVAGAAAFDAANNGNVETTLDAAEALGNAGNAAKSFLGLFTDLSEPVLEDIGLASSGFGLLAAAASFGWQLWGAAKQQAVNTSDNAKFLERGLGLNHNLAQALAAPAGSSPSLVPALEQYAKANGMTPGELLLKLNHFANLNRGYLSNINQFVFQASRMPMQSNGTFPSTAPEDGDNSTIDKIAIENPTKTGQTEWVYEPLPADSLAQLQHWGRVLFGNQLG
jgi:hypothetical protein